MNDDTKIYDRQGFGHRIGFGARPALLVIDFVNGFNDPDQFGGGNIPEAIDRTAELLAHARHCDLPIVFTTITYAEDGSQAGAFTMKVPPLGDIHPGSEAAQVVPELEPRPGERIIEKQYASGFFATDLTGWLAHRGVDTVIVTGCTTSGCVRATVVDAVSHGYRPIVPLECVGDRAQGPHEANLFDMDAKYADVMPLADVIAGIDKLYPGQVPGQAPGQAKTS